MRRRGYTPKIDPFLLWLIGAVASASLFPVRGAGAEAFGVLADLAIALLFFLHGAKLSRQAILSGIGNWRLHAMVFAATYVLFPLAGLATTRIAGGLLNPLLVSGVLFLTLLPSTVQSSIAFTAMARGNVAAAVCSASLSNLVGIVLTPLLVSVMLRAGAAGPGGDLHAVESIVVQLLIPFLAGHFLRPWIGGFVERNKRILTPVDRGSIILVVYSAFSAAVVNGIWHVLEVRDLFVLLGFAAVILAFVMIATSLAGRAMGFSREDRIVLLFCGSKKSLVSGVPMAGALFAPAEVGLIVLPLMIFHQLQLFVCAFLAARFANEDGADTLAETPMPNEPAPGAPAPIPLTPLPLAPAEIDAAAKARGLTIPEPCAKGVADNLALLATHAARLRGETP